MQVLLLAIVLRVGAYFYHRVCVVRAIHRNSREFDDIGSSRSSRSNGGLHLVTVTANIAPGLDVMVRLQSLAISHCVQLFACSSNSQTIVR